MSESMEDKQSLVSAEQVAASGAGTEALPAVAAVAGQDLVFYSTQQLIT
jgi:hypothetical protein